MWGLVAAGIIGGSLCNGYTCLTSGPNAETNAKSYCVSTVIEDFSKIKKKRDGLVPFAETFFKQNDRMKHLSLGGQETVTKQRLLPSSFPTRSRLGPFPTKVGVLCETPEPLTAGIESQAHAHLRSVLRSCDFSL